MSSLFSPDARTHVAAAVREAEGQTAAEFVVVVRREADPHWGAAALLGFITATVTLLALLFAEAEFATHYIPIDIVLAFVIGVAVFRIVPAAALVFVSPKHRWQAAERAAKAAFYDLGISRTKGRTGVLVFAAMAERVAIVLGDVGIDTKAAGSAWANALANAQRSVASNNSESLAQAVVAMGKALSASHPRAEDDENELPDEMVS